MGFRICWYFQILVDGLLDYCFIVICLNLRLIWFVMDLSVFFLDVVIGLVILQKGLIMNVFWLRSWSGIGFD